MKWIQFTKLEMRIYYGRRMIKLFRVLCPVLILAAEFVRIHMSNAIPEEAVVFRCLTTSATGTISSFHLDEAQV